MNNRLTVKDLVNIGIFTALYMLVAIIVMIPSGITPVLWLLWPGCAGIFCGAFLTLLFVKVQKPFTALISIVIVALVYFISGECTWTVLMTCAIAGILAEIARKCFGYNSYRGMALAGAIYAAGLCGSPLPMWLFQEPYMKQIIEMGMTPEYVAKMQTMINPWTLIGMIAFGLLGGFIGILIGKGLFRKHLSKAGIV